MNDLFRIPLDFPDAPTLNEEFTASNGAIYRWDGMVWMPIGASGQGVYLPLAGGTMEGPLVLDADPVDQMDAATKRYVDTVAVGTRQIIGVIDARSGNCVYALATGHPNGPLIDAATAGGGTDILCAIAGTIPPNPLLPVEVWNQAMQVGDILVSDGARWIFVAIPHQTTIASQVAVIPNVFNAGDVQAALEQAERQDMPAGGTAGQVLAKLTATDYVTEWVDQVGGLDDDTLFFTERPGQNSPDGSRLMGTYRTNINNPALFNGIPFILTYTLGQNVFQDAFDTVNGPNGAITARWVRNSANGGLTWNDWQQVAMGNTGAFVLKAGDAMTGPLQISAGAAENQSGQTLQLVWTTPALQLLSTTGGSFKYVNRGNNQGGLTYVSNGVPTYVDWLIWNANNNGLSINNPNGTGINIINGSATITGDMSATAGSFAGPVTEPIAPTQDNHLANKAYVDRAITASRLIIGGIDAATGFCVYTNSSGLVNGPLVPATATQAGAYLLCDNPGTIPGNAPPEVVGIDMALLDMLLSDGAEWHHFATGQGGTITLASQCQLIPNVAGAANAQTGMETLQAQKVAKAGDDMTGSLRFPSSLANGPPGTANTNSAGMRVAIWDNPAGVSFGIGVESGAMWFNNAAANNLYKFYNAGVEKWRLSQNAIDCRHDGDKSINFLSANGTARWWIQTTIGGNDQVFQIAGRTDGGSSYAYLTINRASGQVTVPYGLNSLTVYGLTDLYRDQNTVGLRLRKNNNNSNTDAPSIEITANDGRLLGAFVGRHLGGNGYYGTWPAEVRCDVGSGGYGRQTCWTTRQQGGGFHSLRVQGDVFARNVQLNSDITMKSNVRPLDAEAVNAAFAHLNPVQFHWKPVSVEHHLAAPHGKMPGPDDDPDSVDWGFIADDIEAGAPDLVEGERGSKTYNLAGVVAVMAAKMKQMEAELVQLRERAKR